MNIAAYLKRLDAEITTHRQQIALHQLEIAKIEDARRVIVGIEEREAGHFGADHGLNGEPIVIARRPALGDESGAASKAAKYGALPAPAKKKRDGPGRGLTQRVLDFFEAKEGAHATAEIREALKLDATGTKRLHGTLNMLKTRGTLDWTDDRPRRYFVTGKTVRPQPQPQPQPAYRRDNGAGKVMRAQVAEIVAKKGPLVAGEIVAEVFGGKPYNKPDRDRVYSALHHIRNYPGQVVFDGERYRLRRQEEAA